MAKPVEDWTMEELDAFMRLPAWADRLNTNHELVAGAHLPTKDGRIVGNAHIIDSAPALWDSNVKVYLVLTDAGHTIKYVKEEIEERFHPSEFISNVADVIRKFGKETVE